MENLRQEQLKKWHEMLLPKEAWFRNMDWWENTGKIPAWNIWSKTVLSVFPKGNIPWFVWNQATPIPMDDDHYPILFWSADKSKLKALGLLDGIPRSIGWSEVSPWHWFFWSIWYTNIYYRIPKHVQTQPNNEGWWFDIPWNPHDLFPCFFGPNQLRPSFTPCSPWGWDRYPVRKWIIK